MEEGGTKLTKRQQPPPSQSPQQQAPPQEYQQQQVPQMVYPQMVPQQQQYQQQQYQQAAPFQSRPQYKFNFNDKSFKYAILVVLIFIILNSKIIWKQICKLPMMGVEPSIISLVVNSILAGLIFYLISKFVL